MTIVCRGITLTGEQCNRKVKSGEHCFQHANKFFSSKPSECIICYESLANQRHALKCGHWIHNDCIVKSAKAECPLCRCKLELCKRDMKRIDKLAKIREAERLQEEEEELRENLQTHLSETLRDRIHHIIGNLLDQNENIDHFDVLSVFQDTDLLQGFVIDVDFDESESELDFS